MIPLQFQIPFDVPSLTANIRNYNYNTVQPPCSVTFICLSSRELASRRARKFEASNGTAQWGHTTYTWNVSAVIATVITVRQFADHCLCNTSINAVSCVHTFSLSLSFALLFSLPLSFPRSFVVCIRGLGRNERGKKTWRQHSKDRTTTNDNALFSAIENFNSEKEFYSWQKRYCFEIFIIY